MPLFTTRILTSVFVASLSTSALAGGDDSQSRRDLVQMNQETQSVNGPSGLGQRISFRAKTEGGSKDFMSFGNYLKEKMSE